MAPKNGNGTDLLLYYHPCSFHSQKVAMSLYQKGLKFRPIYVDVSRDRNFNAKLFALNPKGEVPVLVDEVRVLPESEHIINYLEDNFGNGTPRLCPQDHDLKQRVKFLNDLVNSLKIDALTFGSVAFDDLELSPKAPFDDPAYRTQLKWVGENRTQNLLTEMVLHPKDQNMPVLQKRLDEITEEDVWWKDSQKYLDLILEFEKVMDECEAEFQSHEDNRWWLGSPEISIADVSFSILLHRLWQLGFERRMWGDRPFIKRYYSRVQQLESFKLATNMPSGNGFNIGSPYLWGFLGAVALAGGGLYLWNKHQAGNSLPEIPPTILTSKGISSSYGGPDRLKLAVNFPRTHQ